MPSLKLVAGAVLASIVVWLRYRMLAVKLKQTARKSLVQRLFPPDDAPR